MHWTILLREDGMRTPHTDPRQIHICLMLSRYHCKRTLFIRKIGIMLIEYIRYELCESFAGNVYLIVTLIGHEDTGVRRAIRR